jgi:two-component system, OmpR family, sensor histidine kinase KdpD
MTDERPDPDALLAQVERETAKQRRGKLKVFFGATAGVGKTYAMLSAARQLRAQGLDVVVGVVETHGRAETAALLEGLEQLPLKSIEYKGTVLKEFDLDAALKRRPELILVDELAHSNAPGSRHPKRWQDVEELLNLGVDVLTTVNVQHLESLNDVVGGITGIRVWETVADRVFDQAEEVVLVDLPPDELLQRLHEGKVYIPEQAQHAIQNFFRKGNLIALRELALRRTADRVDNEMRAYRRESASAQVWHTKEAILASVGPANGAEKIVRSAARLASQLDAGWHAVYAETPRLQQLPETERRRILETLKLAQDLGAVSATLSAQDAARAIVDYARKNNLTKIVAGRRIGRRLLPWQRDFSRRLSELAPEIDVLAVSQEPDGKATRVVQRTSPEAGPGQTRWTAYGWALLSSAAATLLALPLFPYFDLTNIAMVFLLAVVLVAMRFGRGPAVFAAIVNVVAFDFFFVSPRFSFAVSDLQYLLTFAVMLSIGLVIAHLTSGLRYQARVATHREERAQSLYEMARELSAALVEEQVIQIGVRYVEASFHAKACVILPDLNGRLRQPLATAGHALEFDMAIAQWVFERNEPAGAGTDTLPSALPYLPLRAPLRNRGVLVIEPSNPRLLRIPEQRRQLETFAALIAIALERVHFEAVAREALVKMESERLRNSLLSALSHDLRTPLTALVGLAESLALKGRLNTEQSEIATTIREQALRTSRLVNNLLDMARLEVGEVRLRNDWQSLEELIGAALKASESVLKAHPVQIELPSELPLVECDAVLIERVLANLLENAAKYTPAGTQITISAAVESDAIEVSVSDAGPGLPVGREQALFEKFARGKTETVIPGVGLGLAICKAVVEAHGGSIRAENRAQGGARFVFTLPRSNPPLIQAEQDVHETADEVPHRRVG